MDNTVMLWIQIAPYSFFQACKIKFFEMYSEQAIQNTIPLAGINHTDIWPE